MRIPGASEVHEPAGDVHDRATAREDRRSRDAERTSAKDVDEVAADRETAAACHAEESEPLAASLDRRPVVCCSLHSQLAPVCAGIGSGVGALGALPGLLHPPEEPPRPAQKVVKPKAPAPAGEPDKKAEAPAPAKEAGAPVGFARAQELRGVLARPVKFGGFDDPKATLREALDQLAPQQTLIGT